MVVAEIRKIELNLGRETEKWFGHFNVEMPIRHSGGDFFNKPLADESSLEKILGGGI